jgi:hypothetical protein
MRFLLGVVKMFYSPMWWYISVIPTIKEVKGGESQVQDQPRQSYLDPISKNKI